MLKHVEALELVDAVRKAFQVELARLGGAYRGYSRGLLDAEHRLKGQYSLLGDLAADRKQWHTMAP